MKRLLVLGLVLGVFAAVEVAAASPASPLSGAFQATITGQPAPLNGTWLLTISPNGGYTVTKKPSSTRLVSGLSTASGHSIAFLDKSGLLACPGASARGTYTWTLTGKKLVLKVARDACQGRPLVLAGAAFTRVR